MIVGQYSDQTSIAGATRHTHTTTNSSGYIYASTRVFVEQFDTGGTAKWAKLESDNGTTGYDNATNVVVDTSGNVIVTGIVSAPNTSADTFDSGFTVSPQGTASNYGSVPFIWTIAPGSSSATTNFLGSFPSTDTTAKNNYNGGLLARPSGGVVDILNVLGQIDGDPTSGTATVGTKDSSVTSVVFVTLTAAELGGAPPANSPPVANSDSYSIAEDGQLVVNTASGVLHNDTDAENNALTAVKITDPSHGTLTLNSNGSFTYTPTANFNGTDTFTYKANDGTSNSNAAATVTITVSAVNDPVTAAAPSSATVNEDASVALSGLSISDVDAALAASGVYQVALSASHGTLTLGSSAGLTFTVGSATAAAAMTFHGTLSAINTALATANYKGNANYNGSDTVAFSVTDTFGGVVATGTGSATSDSKNIAVTVTSVNDAPAGTDKTVTILEDASYTVAASDFGFSDANDSPANAFQAVKITAISGGTLRNNGTAVNSGDTVLVSDINLNRLVFTPTANANGAGAAQFKFQVQDDGGTANTGVNLDQSANTFLFNITAVNDAPSSADKTITTSEDTPHIFTVSDFGFSDAADAAGGSGANALLSVTLDSLPSSGSLTFNGLAASAGQVVLASDIAANRLIYTPAPDANGTGLSSFTFHVRDNGGTANGGSDTESGHHTITVNVTSVNDAPSGTDKTITLAEGGAHTFGASDFGFSDARDNPANTLLAVKITTLPTAGTLKLSNVAVTAGQSIAVANLGNLVFAPAAGANGTGYATFTFQVQDNGGTSGGGVDLDPTPNTITADITPVKQCAVGEFANHL